jgi:hypothetical protein
MSVIGGAVSIISKDTGEKLTSYGVDGMLIFLFYVIAVIVLAVLAGKLGDIVGTSATASAGLTVSPSPA